MKITVAAAAGTLAFSLSWVGMSPAVAEPAPTTAPTPTFAMPSVTGTSLAKATDSISGLSETTTFQIRTAVMGGEPVHVVAPGSWVVCRQSPSAGSKINAKSRITLSIERPWTGC